MPKCKDVKTQRPTHTIVTDIDTSPGSNESHSTISAFEEEGKMKSRGALGNKSLF